MYSILTENAELVTSSSPNESVRILIKLLSELKSLFFSIGLIEEFVMSPLFVTSKSSLEHEYNAKDNKDKKNKFFITLISFKFPTLLAFRIPLLFLS